jgi:Gdp/GTP exchange factor required for growth at low temperatures
MDLPDLIDPTAPRDAPAQDIAGYYPSHPEVFDALPPLSHNVQLTVLLNIQKQRLIANVVKSLVDGQHLAAQVQYTVDRKVYQRCLRLRALNYEGMQQALDQQRL